MNLDWGMVADRMLEELPQHRPGPGAPGTEPLLRERWRLPRQVSMAGVALSILVFWVGAGLAAWTAVPFLYLVQRDPLARRRACQRMSSAWFRFFLGALHRMRLFTTRAQVPPNLPRPCVVVANHPTLLDVVAVVAHVDDVCCVVKRPLMANPFVGPLLRACGHISVEGDDLMEGARVMDHAAQRLAEGQRVLIFPEGTRSPAKGLRPFRRGAFEVARRAGVPVVPAFLRCDPPALGKEGAVRHYPKARPVLRVRLLSPVDPGPSSREACQEVMDDFRHRLHQPAPYTS